MRDGRAVVVLAAGASRRFGTMNKLLAQLGGRPLVVHALACAAQVPASQRLAVVAADEVALLASAAGLDVVRVPPSGDQSDSVSAALAALAPGIDSVLMLLGDMPFVTAGVLGPLLAAGPPACAYYPAGLSGPPALLPREWCAAAMLQGDKGLRDVLARIPDSRRQRLEPGLLRDVDFPSDLGV